VHYIHEPGSFVPLVQIRQAQAVALSQTTDVKALIAANGGRYDIEQDPLWNGEQLNTPAPFTKEEIAFYQCDHLGTPQELTDHEGRIAWSASYKAWGEAKQAISEAGRRAGFRNPIRFQGQYWDAETGLHYNRHRYYDPAAGRFVSKDPIGLLGGINLQQYAPNPTEWIDPLGLSGSSAQRRKQKRAQQGGSGESCCSCPQAGRVYRGVSANHPALADAKKGVATPGNINGTVSPDEHNLGGRSADSPYTSWTHRRETAEWWAKRQGPGGVVLEVPTGRPGPKDCWSWEYSIDEYGEQEVLLKGQRKGAKVTKP
jgi:RHS repeat-associated protein